MGGAKEERQGRGMTEAQRAQGGYWKDLNEERKFSVEAILGTGPHVLATCRVLEMCVLAMCALAVNPSSRIMGSSTAN